MQAWKNKGDGQRRRGNKDTGVFPESSSCLRKPWTWQFQYGSSDMTMEKHLRGNKKTLFQIGAQSQLPNPYPAAEYCKATANTWVPATPHGPSALQDGYDLEKVPMTLPLGLYSWVFLTQSLKCPWRMNTHCWSQLHGKSGYYRLQR